MRKISGVRFRDNWKVYDFDATGIDLNVGDKVIVESERGQGLAVVVRLRMQPGAPEPEPVQMERGLQIEQENGETGDQETADKEKKSLRKILRKATGDDLGREAKNREREREAFKTAQDLIAERELPMKLIRVEYSFDLSRAVFFFFSETRVDFRDLVKDLAFKLRTRIEMRQIGVRDVARIIGGFGPCGRELCCTAFLKNFEPVSIRMAKKQDMVLNPAKISGVCGRLLCCLSYEYGMYDEIKKDLANMKETAMQEKKQEEERRVSEERKEIEERRAEEKRRQAERKPQEKRERQKEGGQQGKKKEPQDKQAQQQKRQQQQQQKQQQKGRDQRQQRPEQQKQQEQKERAADREAALQPPQAEASAQPQLQEAQAGEADKAGKKKRRRFWRKKKKGGGPQGENKPPQGPGSTA